MTRTYERVRPMLEAFMISAISIVVLVPTCFVIVATVHHFVEWVMR